MADQRLVDYNISRLSDKNIEVRLRSIEELRLLGDKAALAPLEALFKSDPEAEVRSAAQRAGLEIYKKNLPPPASPPR